MRYLFLLLMVLVLAISPCLWGCGGAGTDPDEAPSVGDPASEFETPSEEPDPDDV
jgi:hypothetical protein